MRAKELMLLNCGVGKALESPWTARRSNQSTLKEISPEYSLEGLMLKLKLQYFGHPMQRTDSLEKTLMLGKIQSRRRRGRQRMRPLDGITNSMNMSLSMIWGLVMVRDGWRTAVHGITKSRTRLKQLNNNKSCCPQHHLIFNVPTDCRQPHFLKQRKLMEVLLWMCQSSLKKILCR